MAKLGRYVLPARIGYEPSSRPDVEDHSIANQSMTDAKRQAIARKALGYELRATS
jgi:hypothetical protein